jgi:hypothetical protein
VTNKEGLVSCDHAARQEFYNEAKEFLNFIETKIDQLWVPQGPCAMQDQLKQMAACFKSVRMSASSSLPFSAQNVVTAMQRMLPLPPPFSMPMPMPMPMPMTNSSSSSSSSSSLPSLSLPPQDTTTTASQDTTVLAPPPSQEQQPTPSMAFLTAGGGGGDSQSTVPKEAPEEPFPSSSTTTQEKLLEELTAIVPETPANKIGQMPVQRAKKDPMHFKYGKTKTRAKLSWSSSFEFEDNDVPMPSVV